MRSSIKLLVLALASVSLVGCETTAQTASLQCGVGGAAAAYLLCKALKRPDAECVRAATVVGIGGAAICYNYASNLERRRKELAGHENDLNYRIRYVRGLNEDTQKFNADLAKRVAETTKQTDDLVVQIRQKKITQEQLAKERQARDDEVKAANAQVAQGNDALKDLTTLRAQQKQTSPEFDAEYKSYQMALAQSKSQVDLLVAQRARV